MPPWSLSRDGMSAGGRAGLKGEIPIFSSSTCTNRITSCKGASPGLCAEAKSLVQLPQLCTEMKSSHGCLPQACGKVSAGGGAGLTGEASTLHSLHSVCAHLSALDNVLGCLALWCSQHKA